MIARHLSVNSAKKSSFGKLAQYISDGQNKAERIGAMRAANCYSDEIEDVIAEVTNTQLMNKRATSAKNYHLLISFRPDDVLSDEMMTTIEAKLCEALGYGEHQRISVAHHDTDNTHIHVAINKIHPTRHTMHTPKGDYRTLLKVSEEIEQQYGLLPDNHEVKKKGAQNRALDMEHKAGVQSLLTWLQHNCLDQLKAAKNWQEVHNVLQSKGIELKIRGNGLVFVSTDGMAVKASSVDRTLSKINLVKCLGEFVPLDATSQTNIHLNTRKSYCKKPTGVPRQDKLYERYTTEQSKVITQRDKLLLLAKQKKEKRILDIKTSANLKRALIKNMPRGIGRQVLYWSTYQSQGMQIKRAKKNYLNARKQIYAQYARVSWKQWLLENNLMHHKNKHRIN